MVTDKLQRVIDEVPGCVGCVLMRLDGGTVESAAREGKLGIGVLGGELSYIVSRAQQAAVSLSLGTLDEMAIKVEQLVVALRLVDEQHFVIALISPQGSYGKCRELLSQLAPELAAELRHD